MLVVPPIKNNDPAVIASAVQALADAHAHGFKLAFNNTVLTPAYEKWLPLASYLKIDLV